MTVDLTNIEQFIIDTIKTEFPDIDFREGTAFRDILIKPETLILQPLADEISNIKNNQTINNAATMSEDDFDSLMANIFVTRRTGQKSTGVVRVLFADPQTVTIASGTTFLSNDNRQFITRQSFTTTAEGMSLNVDGSFFYIEVNAEAVSEGVDANIEPGSIVSIVGGPQNVVSVTNPSAFTGGQQRENNTDLALRAKFAITVRDLNTEPAIKHILFENFESVLAIRPIGFGDPEMIRDVLSGQNLSLGDLVLDNADEVNIGGKVDIYIKVVALQTQSIDVASAKPIIYLRPYNADIDGVPQPTNANFLSSILRPVIRIQSIEEINPVTGLPTGRVLVDGIDYEWLVDAPSLTYSNQERTRVRLLNTGTPVVTGSSIYIGSILRINYLHCTEVPTIQAFVTARENRIINADLLVKHAVPAFVDMEIEYQSIQSPALSEDDARTVVINAINTLDFGGRLELSDLVDVLYNAGADYVKPFVVTATTRNVDGSFSVVSSNDAIDLSANVIFIPGTVILKRITV